MSATRCSFIHCDGCGVSDEADYSNRTAADARSFLDAEGWHVGRPGGRDICPMCWEEGAR